MDRYTPLSYDLFQSQFNGTDHLYAEELALLRDAAAPMAARAALADRFKKPLRSTSPDNENKHPAIQGIISTLTGTVSALVTFQEMGLFAFSLNQKNQDLYGPGIYILSPFFAGAVGFIATRTTDCILTGLSMPLKLFSYGIGSIIDRTFDRPRYDSIRDLEKTAQNKQDLLSRLQHGQAPCCDQRTYNMVMDDVHHFAGGRLAEMQL